MNAQVKDAATVDAKAVHTSLYAALAAAQAEMGKAIKDTSNPHFRTKYADLASVMDACMPALTRHGIAVIQPPCDEDGQRYVKTVLLHGETGQSAECRVPLIVSKNDMQGYGSAVTYARRYGLMSMAGIAPEDDDGNAAAKAPPVVEDREPPRQQRHEGPTREAVEAARDSLTNAETLDQLAAIWGDLPNTVRTVKAIIDAKDASKVRLSKARNADLGEDDLPY